MDNICLIYIAEGGQSPLVSFLPIFAGSFVVSGRRVPCNPKVPWLADSTFRADLVRVINSKLGFRRFPLPRYKKTAFDERRVVVLGHR